MSKTVLLICVVGWITITTTWAQPSHTAEELLAFEKARVQATLMANTTQLEAMLADELVWIHSNGKIDSKTTYIQDIANQKSRYQTLEVVESKARLYGDIGITNGKLKVEFYEENNTVTALTVLFTAVYRQQGGQWQVVSWQTTKLN